MATPVADRTTLLGLGPDRSEVLDRLAQGDPLEGRCDLLDRNGYLLEVYRDPEEFYPGNPVIRRAWMRSPNRAFGGSAPVQIMRKSFLAGLVMVRARLDRMGQR